MYPQGQGLGFFTQNLFVTYTVATQLLHTQLFHHLQNVADMTWREMAAGAPAITSAFQLTGRRKS